MFRFLSVLLQLPKVVRTHSCSPLVVIEEIDCKLSMLRICNYARKRGDEMLLCATLVPTLESLQAATGFALFVAPVRELFPHVVEMRHL